MAEKLKKNIKNILVIVDSIDIDDSSGSKANAAFITNLNDLNYNLSVFHYTKKKIQLNNIKCFLVKELKGNPLYFLSRLQRVFTRLTKIKLNKLFEGLFGFSFTFFNDVNSIKSFIKKELKFHPDLVITLSKGGSFRPHYAVLKLPEYHNIWLAYVHDPYPFSCYPKPYKWFEPGYQYKERFFKKVSLKARYSAFPSLFLKEWMGRYYPNFLVTGKIIPHQKLSINTSKIKVPSFFDEHKFNLLHAGNLMKQRSPKGLIEGFKLFLKNNPNAKKNARLLLVGNASCHKKLLDFYKKEIKELKIISQNIPFKEMFYIQMKCAVNIILESKSKISPFLPGKFPHCVKANKPILLLAPLKSETYRLLGTDYPYFSEVDDIKTISEKINVLYNFWLKNGGNIELNRPDLQNYISSEYLKEVLISL